MKISVLIITLTAMLFFFSSSYAAPKQKNKNKKIRAVATELTEKEKRLVEAGEKIYKELDKQQGTPLPESLKEKMQRSGPDPRN